jgi:hypothetical protein
MSYSVRCKKIYERHQNPVAATAFESNNSSPFSLNLFLKQSKYHCKTICCFKYATIQAIILLNVLILQSLRQSVFNKFYTPCYYTCYKMAKSMKNWTYIMRLSTITQHSTLQCENCFIYLSLHSQ